MKKDNPLSWMSTPQECRDTLILLLRQLVDYGTLEEEKATALHRLLSYYGRHHREEGEKILEGIFFNHETDVIAKSVMSAINGGDIRISVSRLEQYATCAYRYFLQYALKLEEKRTNAFASYDIGNLYHEALERFSQKIKDSGESWFSVSDEKTALLLDEAILDTMEQMKKTQVFDSARDSFVLMMMKNTLKRTVWALMKQVRAGKFEPKGFEVKLSEISSLSSLTYELSDHSRLSLNGVIDRLDTYETPDKVYVKILDYKSGNKDLDLLSLYYGLQIQLVFYAGAAVEGLQQSTDKEVLPGAVMYYHIDDPLVDAAGEEGDLADRILRSLKPKGEIFAADEVIEAMDADFAKGETAASDVFDMKKNKDGSLSKSSRVMSGEDFGTMISFVKRKVHILGEAMASGEIAIHPYSLGENNGCTYCPYKGVCGFDPALEGYGYRKLKKIPKEELLAKMKEEEDA